MELSQYHNSFFEECRESLDQMESSVLDLEGDRENQEFINTIFRAAHSVKGGSATFGFIELSSLTHNIETLVDQVRGGIREITPQISDLLLRSTDCLRELLDAEMKGMEKDHGKIDRLSAELETVCSLSQAVAANDDDEEMSEEEFDQLLAILGNNNRISKVSKGSSGASKQESGEPEEKHGKAPVKEPASEIREFSQEEYNQILQWLAPESANDPSPADRRSGVDRRSVPRADGHSGNSGSTIRVSTEKIDSLMNQIGELVITQSMLKDLGHSFNTSKLPSLLHGLAELERTSRNLQESVLNVRMVPVSTVFARFPRLVRDVCLKLEKKVDLVMSGEDTEIDKTIAESLADPLVHLLRNSLDHGIEPPSVRLENNKTENGTIHLRAFHQDGNICIEVKDDGKGLSREKILEKAIEKGLIQSDAGMSDSAIYGLIMEPGFSTAENVSDLSGRGVGMDVVRRNIRSLGGDISFSSEEGKGLKVSIRLPLTLAIMEGQVTRVGDQRYILPVNSIIETRQVMADEISEVAGGQELYRYQQEYIEIVRLSRIFGVQARNEQKSYLLVAVVQTETRRMGFLIDELLTQQQVVVRSIEDNYFKVEGIAGATVLGNGSVSLILDIPGVLDIHNRIRDQESIAAIGIGQEAFGQLDRERVYGTG